MKTTMIVRYIHDKTTTVATTLKKSGKPSRPSRGPKIGACVAMVLDDEHYGLNISLVNPGRSVRGGKQVDADKFDRTTAVRVAIAKIVEGDPLPYVVTSTPTTNRASNIWKQVDEFQQQAARVFKDKTPLLYVRQARMVKTGFHKTSFHKFISDMFGYIHK